MSSNEAVRARVTSALEDIEAAQRDLGIPYCDRGDLEVHQIIARIEQRLAKARKPRLVTEETTP